MDKVGKKEVSEFQQRISRLFSKPADISIVRSSGGICDICKTNQVIYAITHISLGTLQCCDDRVCYEKSLKRMINMCNNHLEKMVKEIYRYRRCIASLQTGLN